MQTTLLRNVIRMILSFAANVLLLSAANLDAEETTNVPGQIVLLLLLPPLALAGCLSFSKQSVAARIDVAG